MRKAHIGHFGVWDFIGGMRSERTCVYRACATCDLLPFLWTEKRRWRLPQSEKGARGSEWDKISPKGRMSTRSERSQKFRKKRFVDVVRRPRKVAQLQIQMALRWKRPSEIDCPSNITTFILLTHVPQLATETLLTALSLPLLIGGYYPVVL